MSNPAAELAKLKWAKVGKSKAKRRAATAAATAASRQISPAAASARAKKAWKTKKLRAAKPLPETT